MNIFEANFQSRRGAITAYFLSIVLILFYGFIQGVIAQGTQASPALNPQLPTIFVIGDSTAQNNANGLKGWGDSLGSFFETSKINVANRARAGRSSRTFMTEGLWDKVLNEMKKGDFVLIQFGHNDSDKIDSGRFRGSLPGTGEETRAITFSDGRQEVVHTYGWYLRKFITDTKAKGATPIVLSLTVRNLWKDGKVERGSGQFGQWAAEISEAQGVSFLDLTNIIADKYEQMGEENVKSMFPAEYVHTSPQGAELNAALVVVGLKRLKITPLVDNFSDKGKGTI